MSKFKGWRCFIGYHDWRMHQRGLLTSDDYRQVVIAWQQCDKCAASKLVHILE